MKKLIFIFIFGMLVTGCSKDSEEINTTDSSIPIPDGKLVFRKSDHHLYTIDLNGSNEKQITSEDRNFAFWNPKWSPDGKNILYIYDHPGTKGRSIFMMDEDGNVNSRREIVEPASGLFTGYSSIDWFPDGQKIAYELSNKVHIHGLDGEYQKEYSLEGGSYTISPDGNKIASLGINGIYVLDLTNEEFNLINNISSSSFIYISASIWSPNSQKLANGRDLSTGSQLVTIDINTGKETMIFQSTDKVVALGWTRDAKYIVYKLLHSDTYEVVQISTGGRRHIYKSNEHRGFYDLHLF